MNVMEEAEFELKNHGLVSEKTARKLLKTIAILRDGLYNVRSLTGEFLKERKFSARDVDEKIRKVLKDAFTEKG